jgi:hypothetical protein
MAHGFAGVKEHGLERFARAFAEAWIGGRSTAADGGERGLGRIKLCLSRPVTEFLE